MGAFLDIESTFDNTLHAVIREALTNRKVLVDWTQSMLVSRNVTVCHNDVTVYGRLARDCPQGGVLSPLLWCFVIELLAILQTAGFLTFGYADDVAVIVRQNFLPILKERIEAALKII